MTWSPDIKAEAMRRTHNARHLAYDPVMQFRVLNYYRTRPAQWIEDWAVTYDPRRDGARMVPFRMFPRQRQYIQFLQSCLADKEGGLVEKCRDGGLTWLSCAFSVWLWLFAPSASVGFGSRKEQLVDKIGDPDSIFEKIRIIIRCLPRWMLPEGFEPMRHMSYMKIINPANGSTIKGEAGDNIGRGGRSLIFFKDESAHYERPELIEAALGNNTDVQIDISSVNGSDNVFYKRRMAGQIWSPDAVLPKGRTRVFIFDWRDDPRKTQEWYDTRRAKAEAEGLLHIFAQEVDRDYSSSVMGIIIRPEWARACLDAHIKLAHLGDWFAGERIAGQDVADGGRDRNAYVSRHGSVVHRIASWAGEAGDAARQAIPMAAEDGIRDLNYDCIGVGTGFKVEVNRMKEEPVWPHNLRVTPWDASEAPLNPTDHVILGDAESPTNEAVYENLKAQAWFALRARCWKTYLAIERGQVFPVSEMISIPSALPEAHQLILEFSQPVKKTSLTSGKTCVDKKPEGATSPNNADACVMAFHPCRSLSILDIL